MLEASNISQETRRKVQSPCCTEEKLHGAPGTPIYPQHSRGLHPAPHTPSPHSPNAGALATAEADANRARNPQSTSFGGITRTHQPPRLRQEIPVPFPYRTLGLVNPCLLLSPSSYFISRRKSFLTLSSPHPILIRCPP